VVEHLLAAVGGRHDETVTLVAPEASLRQ